MTDRCNRKFTLSEIKQKLKVINSSIEVTDNVYVNSGTPLQLRCNICNHVWKSRWDHLKRGHGCPCCAGVDKLTIDKVKQQLLTINPNFIILDDVFLNNCSKLQVYCKVHDSIQLVKWQNLKYGKGCKKCGIERRSGKAHPNWRGGSTEIIRYFRQVISEWKLTSMKLANYKCDITGLPFTDIHHIYPFTQILRETFNLCKLDMRSSVVDYTEKEMKILTYTFKHLHKYKYPLGVCLTHEMHMLFHNIYGRGNTTLQQYVEFKNNYNKRND